MRQGAKIRMDGLWQGLAVPGRPEDDEERSRLLHALGRAIEGELTQRQRDCLQMRYFDNRKITEIAQALQITPGTVSRHLAKARRALHRVLGYSFPRLNG